MHLPVRPGTAWARPLFVGLIVLSLVASASVAVAASAAVPAPSSLPPSVALATGNAIPAPTTAIPAQPTGRPTTRVATVAPPIVRPQVVVKPTVVVTPPTAKPVARTVAKTVVKTVAKPVTTKSVTPHYSGVYHLWIPALGLSRSINDWGCRGGLIPNRVEYWGCAGKNNLYLLGHAWGVFAKIHDGYHSGALRVGLTAYYADKAGNTHRYRISQIRHVTNASYATWSRWAMASSSGPIITLQTCDGPTSAYRILVRLVPV